MGIFHSRNLCYKKDHTISRLWEECTQEEARLIRIEEKMGEYDNQALTTHAKEEKDHEDEDHAPWKNLLSISTLDKKACNCDW